MKEQGFPDYVSEYGAQRIVLRPRCIGAKRAQTQLPLCTFKVFKYLKQNICQKRLKK
jgi:hypothetical protein